ncbi:UNVERIFIED_CONTAM: hypothetical protein FKN15_041855 [Acipenser sinensis]
MMYCCLSCRNEVESSHGDTKGDHCATVVDSSRNGVEISHGDTKGDYCATVVDSSRFLHTKSTAYNNIIFCNLVKVPPLELRGCFTALMSSKDQCRGKAKKLLQRRVKDAVSASAVMFSGYSEHDAHEFLNHCLVQLKEDGKKLVMAGEELQATSLGISLSMYSCPVITNMDFQLQYKMTCTGCGDFSVRQELFTMLSISVVPGCSIQDCLDHYFKGADEEELGDEEEELLRIAIALSLQDLNHTETEPDVDEDSMNTSTVESKEGRSGAETGELCSSYRLISLVSHLGNRVSTGHYISDVYDFLADKWLTYDDEKASETDESAVQAERKCTGYIFFYMHNNGTGTGTPCEGGESSPLCAERVLKDTGELYSSYRLICLVSHLGSQVSTVQSLELCCLTHSRTPVSLVIQLESEELRRNTEILSDLFNSSSCAAGPTWVLMSLQSPGCMWSGIASHKLVHALGLVHEQSRIDRDKYITILWENVLKGSCFQAVQNSVYCRSVRYEKQTNNTLAMKFGWFGS